MANLGHQTCKFMLKLIFTCSEPIISLELLVFLLNNMDNRYKLRLNYHDYNDYN
jgi:hypothetical protein